MRLTIERDGRTETVEVDPDLATVTVGGRRFPVVVVARSATKVELEIDGERVVVENWPEHFPEPPGPVDVNGERWAISVARVGGVAASRSSPASPVPSVPAPTAPPAGSSDGRPVVPPMPGKVVEVRVREGERVAEGAVLLVLEAMKMRNEIVAPVAGVVRGLVAVAGGNARAREPLLYLVPA